MNISKHLAMTVLCTMLVGLAVTDLLAADEKAAKPETGASAQADASNNMQTMMALRQAMQAQMAAIRAEKDPAKRAQLMSEHMTSMQAAMQALQKNGGCTMGNMGNMPGGGMGGGAGMNMGNGMGNMGNGMGMMQMMMEQMQQHQEAMQQSGK